jgi:hypothetical protein
MTTIQFQVHIASVGVTIDRHVLGRIGIKSELHDFSLTATGLPSTLDVNQGRTALFIFARAISKAISHGFSRSALFRV